MTPLVQTQRDVDGRQPAADQQHRFGGINVAKRFTEYADVSQADPAEVAILAEKLKGLW